MLIKPHWHVTCHYIGQGCITHQYVNRIHSARASGGEKERQQNDGRPIQPGYSRITITAYFSAITN